MALTIESSEERHIIDYLVQNKHVSFFRMFENFSLEGKLYASRTPYQDRHVGYYLIQAPEVGQNVNQFRVKLTNIKALIDNLKQENFINVIDTKTDIQSNFFVDRLTEPHTSLDEGISNIVAECRRLEIIALEKLIEFKENGYTTEKKESKILKYISIAALFVSLCAVIVAIRNCGYTQENYKINKKRDSLDQQLNQEKSNKRLNDSLEVDSINSKH